MSSSHPFLEYEYFHNLTNFNLDLFEKSNEYFLYFTIFISIITIIITLSTVFESNILFKFILLFLKLKSLFFRRSSFSLNWLLNRSNHIQKRFINEFIYIINQKLSYKSVIEVFSLIIIQHLCFFYIYICYVIIFLRRVSR